MSLSNYDMLNTIKSPSEFIKSPYTLPYQIYHKQIMPTYREIHLKYIKGHNFYIKQNTVSSIKGGKNNKSCNISVYFI